jgi:apolipoprotein N-acyltransferase
LPVECYLFPESSFPVYLNENSIRINYLIQRLDNQLIKNKTTNILGGLYSYRAKNNDTSFYNTAFMFGSNIQIYHKSKLVIGVEKMPFQEYLHFLKNWNLDFGGFSSSLTTDNVRKVFYSCDSSLRIAPIICYESVYGQFVSEFINEGAKCIAVITNDGWWGDTPGNMQHLMHSQLRAVETRKSVARAANTGVSCFINQKGDIILQSKVWEQNYLIGSIHQNDIKTFYTRNGDYIGKISLFGSLLTLFYCLYLYLSTRIRKR